MGSMSSVNKKNHQLGTTILVRNKTTVLYFIMYNNETDVLSYSSRSIMHEVINYL